MILADRIATKVQGADIVAEGTNSLWEDEGEARVLEHGCVAELSDLA